MERRAGGSEGSDQRQGKPVVVDLERLEQQAEDLYLTRFVAAVKAARGQFGRYLTLRTGDELAIRAAGDGSSEKLDEVVVDGEPES
jgi:ADP-dependent phosphofructokinase/glucokinase